MNIETVSEQKTGSGHDNISIFLISSSFSVSSKLPHLQLTLPILSDFFILLLLLSQGNRGKN